MMKLELSKSGKNKHGMWCFGLLVADNWEYNGIFNLDKEYNVVDGSIYEVKHIKAYTDRKGILRFTIELK